VKNWGIRSRVLLLALLPALLIAVMLAGYMVYRVSSDAERELRTYGSGLARQLAAVAEFAAYSGDREALRKIALAALDETHILAVVIYDAEGLPIADSAAPSARLSALSPVAPAALLAGDESGLFGLLLAAPIIFHRPETPDALLLESSTPPRTQPATLGWVTLKLSRTAMQQRKGEAMFVALFSTFVLLALAGLLALLLGRQVTRPIIRLQDAVAQIQAGHLEARVLANSGGDLQRLEEGLNAMAEALRENRTLLQMKIALATHELEEKKNEAERDSMAKSRFLAAASHDLRQPLHALSLFAADLGRELLTPTQQRLSQQINASATGITGLLDALLDISRLDLAEVVPQKTIFSLNEVFARLENVFCRQAQGKGLRFRCRPSPLWAFSDRGLLERLLSNLADNAIAYTPAGSIFIAARRQGDGVRIEVRDSGIGLALEDQHAVFQEFFQVGNIGRVQGKGLGLGLAIVRRIARILGISVDLRSAPGKGSVFSVRMPLAPSLGPSARNAVLRPALDSAADSSLPQPSPRLAICRPATPALEGVAALAARWGMAVTWIESLDEVPAGAGASAGGERIVVLDLLERFAATAGGHPAARRDCLVLLGNTGQSKPDNAHVLALPLRPAKLRALLNELFSTTA
jgi:signal transduction histidine kinase